MRVLVLGLGGVTSSFRNWPERVVAKALAERGHEVRAIGTWDPARPALRARQERIDGVDVRRVKSAYWPNPELAAALEAGPRPDLIHLMHPRNVLAAQTTAWAQRRGIPTLYTWLGPLHDEHLVLDRERPLEHPPRYERLVFTRAQLLRRLAGVASPRAGIDLVRNYRLHWPLRAAQHLVPCSRFEADAMRRMGLVQPLTVIPLWIDPSPRPDPGAPASRLSASRPWLLFVGQLTPRKGYDTALRALPEIRRRQPGASLLLVSGLNPAERDAALRLGQTLGVEEHVHFLGRLEDAELATLFSSCDVYLSPTRYEGFGLTLLEAMAAGAPLVASDVPVVNEIVGHERNGLLFPAGDASALAAAVLRMLEEPGLAPRLRAGGTATLHQEFDKTRLANELVELYRKVAASSRRAASQPPHPEQHANEYFAGQLSKSERKIRVQYRRLFALAGLKRELPQGLLLDLGCGAGPGLRFFAQQGADACGLDRSFYALRQAQGLLGAPRLLQGDAAGNLPFRDASFALVLATEIIEHLSDGPRFLEECRRILRPDGLLVLTTPNLWDLRRLLAPVTSRPWSGDADPTHVNLYTPARLARELRAAGFRPRLRTGLKPMLWLPPHRDPLPIPYPPLVGNGIVATGVRLPDDAPGLGLGEPA